jgi:cytosine/creatinine deaminase
VDWIIRQGSIPRREGTFDIGIEGERIVAVEPQLEATAAQEIDATGQLLTPTLIDPHVHLDKSLISEVVRDNVSGTLSEAIEIIWEKKKNYSEEDILERAGRVIEWAVRHGTTFLRSHVDVDTLGGLKPLEGVQIGRASCRERV